MTGRQKELKAAAAAMTRGIALRPNILYGRMYGGEGSAACALGTLREGSNLDIWSVWGDGERALSEALRPRFCDSIVGCNDLLHVPREAMIQVACEDAGLADG